MSSTPPPPPPAGAPLPNQPQYGAPQGYYPPLPPQKKSHTLRNVLLILLLLGVLIIGGCMALIGGAVNEVDKAIKEQNSQDAQPGGADAPMEIKPGQAFEVRGFSYQPGWKVGKDALGDFEIKGLKVENNRDEEDSALVEIKVWRGSEVLASSDCTSDSIAPGTTVTLSCLSADKMPKSYDKITINDTF